ncbi:MAG: hypothetical protein ACRECD_12590 [Burkholderiaceae bacterium]
MVRLILALALASIAAGIVYGQEPIAQSATVTPPAPDPLASAECQAARQQLQGAQAAATDSGYANALALGLAREQAALACFGSANRSAIRAPQPEVAVPPIATPLAPPPMIAAPRSPVAVPRPSLITLCDPGGCWSSDGMRLHRAGPNLVGPRGLCTVQGNVLSCP